MENINIRKQRRLRRVRLQMGRGTAEKPRVSVLRSNKYINAQVIDDEKKVTIVGISSKATQKAKNKKSVNVEIAKEVGKSLGEMMKKKNVTKAIFDRGSHLYHGRVQAFAEGLREAGIEV